MNLEQTFEVQAPIDSVWHALNDLERVAPCLPGATITGHEDGTYYGEFTLRVGPFSAVHRGTIRIVETDAIARMTRLVVAGTNGNGSGATIVSTLSDLGGATRVDAVAELTVGGALAGFVGATVIQDISSRLLRDFATCLSGHLVEPEAVSGTGATAPVAPTAPGTAPAPSGAEVTAGDAAPEEVLGAAPEAQDPPDPDSAAASSA